MITVSTKGHGTQSPYKTFSIHHSQHREREINGISWSTVKKTKNKPNQRGASLLQSNFQISEESDWERPQKMETYPMNMDRQHWYCENHHPTKSNLKIQLHLTQNLHPVPHRNRKKNPKTHMEPAKTLDIQTIVNKKNNAGATTISDLKVYYSKTITKSYDLR